MEEEKRFHVLAVDDSIIDRKLLERLLKLSSYQVTFVESGDEALEYLGLNGVGNDDINPLTSSSQQKEVKVNLIMTDYCMPGMNGYDLLRRLKGSSWKDVPVVVMSSENVPSRVTMCLEGGAEEFLLKPLRLSDLEKLQPYLTKSNHTCCKSISKDSDKSTTRHGEDQMNVTKSNSNNNNFNNEASTKRKAVSNKDTPDKRRKIQQQAVA